MCHYKLEMDAAQLEKTSQVVLRGFDSHEVVFHMEPYRGTLLECHGNTVLYIETPAAFWLDAHIYIQIYGHMCCIFIVLTGPEVTRPTADDLHITEW